MNELCAVLALLALLALQIGCGELPAQEEPPPVWTDGIDAVLAPCTECHREESASFFTLVTTCTAEGEPWVIAGDADSPVLRVLTSPDHAARLAPRAQDELRAWIVDEELTFTSAAAHPRGWSLSHGVPRDPRPCAHCHDAPKEKGGAIACTTCHAKRFAVNACDNCHDHVNTPCDSPLQRATNTLHQLHLAGGEDASFPRAECKDCHVVPSYLLERGHFDDGTPDAEVSVYSAGGKSCSVPTCHAAKEQTWTLPSDGDRCARCHGNPPPDHASDRCADCHQNATHLDRTLDVGVACDSCHPREKLSGAHARHIDAGALRTAIDCSTCHEVPASRDSPGHIDSAPPAEVTVPSWSHLEARCTNVGCHGGLPTDLWTSTSPAACGSCHGLPPVEHLPTGDADCGVCHQTPKGESITLGTGLITEAGKTVHINGRVDVVEGL